jgi:membrane peptidoglycan carboxypeptidase
LVLGQSEVTVLEMTGAFATLANGGVFNRAMRLSEFLTVVIARILKTAKPAA